MLTQITQLQYQLCTHRRNLSAQFVCFATNLDLLIDFKFVFWLAVRLFQMSRETA